MVDVRVIGQCDRMHDRIKPYLSNDGRCACSQSYQSFKEALDVDHDACAMMSERVVVVECQGGLKCSGGVWCA